MMDSYQFSLWPDKSILRHSYFEKSMKNQTLVVERTAMGRTSIMSIMTNELMRRLLVLDEGLDISEKIEVVEKYTRQLVNSEYN